MTDLGVKVKFLFFGTRIHECFTYMHYLEAVRRVEYRYSLPFTGLIVDGSRMYDDTFNLFIRDYGVEAGDGARIYENLMVERGIAKFITVGNSSMSCIELEQARDTYFELLDLSPSFYIKERFTNTTRPKSFKQQKLIAL
jgi:aminoglycoside 3-N-acetyltransferase